LPTEQFIIGHWHFFGERRGNSLSVVIDGLVLPGAANLNALQWPLLGLIVPA
jgi:hypothetical protein